MDFPFHDSPRARWSLLIIGSAVVVGVTITATFLLMNQAPTQTTKPTTLVVTAPSDRDHWAPAALPTPSPTPTAVMPPMAHVAPMPQLAQSRFVQPHIPSPAEQQRREDARRGMQSDLAFQTNTPGTSLGRYWR